MRLLNLFGIISCTVGGISYISLLHADFYVTLFVLFQATLSGRVTQF